MTGFKEWRDEVYRRNNERLGLPNLKGPTDRVFERNLRKWFDDGKTPEQAVWEIAHPEELKWDEKLGRLVPTGRRL